MQLIEYIKRLNTKILFKYLLKGEDKVHFSESLYESLQKQVLDQSFIEERLHDFDDEGIMTLFSIYLAGVQGLKFESAHNKALLLRSFQVYEKTKDEELYLAPFEEFNHAIAAILQKKTITSNRQVAFVLPFKDAFKTDLALLFGLLVKKGSVLKQTGFVTKQFLDSYLSVTHLGGLIRSLSLSDSECESLIDYLLSLLERCSYLQRERNVIKVSSLVETDFNTLLLSMREDILSVIDLHGINSRFLCALVSEGAVALEKQYFSSVSFYALVILAWLGEFSVAISGKSVVISQSEVSELEVYYPSGHMMPDFSVMIPREIDPVSLLEYMKIGSIDSLDMIYKGTVCRETIVDSVAGTFQEDAVRRVIEKWNGSPNLYSTIEEWIHGFNKLFVDGTYLAIKGTDAEAVTSLPEIAPLVNEIEGYRFFRIKNGKETLLETILKSKNFDTRFPDSSEPSHLFTKDVHIPDLSEELVNFDPQMESSTTPVSQGGIYSSQLKVLSVGDIGKLVKYATLMDYKLTIDYANEFDEVKNYIITPINLAGGKDSFIEASDESGTVRKFLLEKIEKIGVLSDDC